MISLHSSPLPTPVIQTISKSRVDSACKMYPEFGHFPPAPPFSPDPGRHHFLSRDALASLGSQQWSWCLYRLFSRWQPEGPSSPLTQHSPLVSYCSRNKIQTLYSGPLELQGLAPPATLLTQPHRTFSLPQTHQCLSYLTASHGPHFFVHVST